MYQYLCSRCQRTNCHPFQETSSPLLLTMTLFPTGMSQLLRNPGLLLLPLRIHFPLLLVYLFPLRRCPNGAMVVMVQLLFLDEVGLLILSLCSLYSQVVRSTLQMASMLPSGVAVSLIRNMVTIVNTLKIIKKGIQKLSGCLLFALLYLWPIKHHCFCCISRMNLNSTFRYYYQGIDVQQRSHNV